MSVPFAEVNILDIIPMLLDTTGGAEYQTNVIVVQSGFEQRNQNWIQSRGTWQLGERGLGQSEVKNLTDFFHARRGKFQGFRYKDWSDYIATYANGVLDQGGVGSGLATYQLYKNYASGGFTYHRAIVKPINTMDIPLTVKLNGSVVSATVDTETGIVTLSPVTTLTITAITKATQGVVTFSGSHSFSDGQVVYISGVLGMTQVNNQYYTVTVVSSNSFRINANTTSYGTYTSGGTISIYPQAADTLTWAGEFDVPVRFDTDQIQYRLEQIINNITPWFYLMSLPIVELRLL